MAAEMKKNMVVMAADGEVVGKVASVSEWGIKLIKDFTSDDCEHVIPVKWVAKVDNQIHLTLTLTLTEMRVELSEKPTGLEDANAHLPIG